MKKFLSIVSVIAFSLFIFSSCEKEEEIVDENLSQVPSTFKVDIPNSISSSAKKSTTGDVLAGNDIYENMRTFIAVGEEAADIVQAIMKSIGENNLSQAMEFSFTSEDDGRTKNVIILENVEFEGVAFAYQLTITDTENEVNTDGGKALQVFWNNTPVNGVSILKPSNLNVNDIEDWAGFDAMFRIDYSEVGTNGYEQEMTVSIVGLKDVDALADRFAIKQLKMFVGKDGDRIDVYGNSGHPNAAFFGAGSGMDWAFVASGSYMADIAAAQVGLPPYDLDSDVRSVLLEEHSIKNVLTNAILVEFPNATQIIIDTYLANTGAPGYFSANGFLTGGVSPGVSYDPYSTALENLVPYNPLSIKNLVIDFK